jgi:uncharacterized protein with FMN-binding domain
MKKYYSALLIPLVAIIHCCSVHQEMIEYPISSPDLAVIDDGEYFGEFDQYRWFCEVNVMVNDHRIDTIHVLKSANGTKKLNKELVNRVIEFQTPQVDAVSGATITSNTCLKAIEKALLEAGGK